MKIQKQTTPGPSRNLHAGVKSRLTFKVIHDDAMITIDDMLVDALSTEMLKDFVDAVNTVQDGLEERSTFSVCKITHKKAQKNKLILYEP